MFRETRGWRAFAARLERVSVGASKARCQVWEMVPSIRHTPEEKKANSRNALSGPKLHIGAQ